MADLDPQYMSLCSHCVPFYFLFTLVFRIGQHFENVVCEQQFSPLSLQGRRHDDLIALLLLENVWMTLDFPLMTLFVQLVPGNAKTAGTVQQTSRRGRKNRFSLKNEACQAPHRCYKSAPAYMSCVDNIPTVCAPWPLFSLCRALVGLQLKHRALFFFFSSSSSVSS